MSFNPEESGGPIYVGYQEDAGDRPGDAIVDEIQKHLPDDYWGNGKTSLDLSSWDELMDAIDSMSSNDLIRWIGKHHDLSEANASVLDTLLTNKINKENVLDERDYNSYVQVMKRMKDAGINPALAFRTGENQVSYSGSRSSLASQFAREASLEETSKRNNVSTILGVIGAIMGVVGLLIAL